MHLLGIHFDNVEYQIKNKEWIEPEHIEGDGADGGSDDLIYFKCSSHYIGNDTLPTNAHCYGI